MDKYLDLLFPKFCLGCKSEGSYLCQDCRSLLEILEQPYCLCENPVLLPSNLGKCQKCRDKNLAGLYFAMPYKDKLAQNLIKQFKYQHLKDLAKTLASILIEHFVKAGLNTNSIWEGSLLVPVPLHIKKLRERGYNQAELLANELAKVLELPVLADVLIKTRKTDSQMELPKEGREKNLSGAFEIKPAEDGLPPVFAGKRIFLVDDVYTTGSTMAECASVLRKAGAKSVWGIALAREEYHLS